MASLTNAQKLQLLGAAPLFSSLAERDLEAIASLATTRNLKAREELFHKGDDGS
ncbi:MAG: hypothetical protein JRH01_15830 [Deltaproteobacteria bacterium]|nr:hypothetical protein [Deltaproteobacteria bacterium]MBW2395470.1 hypothetical protein [Deltaproteobacteria bacterium]